jgi:glycosyltransferase involved in cell wall biosynthesis
VAVPLLARAIAQRGHRVTILTTRRERGSRRVVGYRLPVVGQGERTEDRKRPTLNEKGQWSVVSGQSSVVTDGVEYVFTQRSTEFYKMSWELAKWLRANVRNFDLVHIHALFSFASTAASFIAAKNKVPYIVRPLGVLNRWGLENRRAVLKRGSLFLIERRILSHAAAIHYTSDAEKAEACKLGNWVKALPSFITALPVPVPKLPPRRVIGAQISVDSGAEESGELATASSSCGEQGAKSREGFWEKFPEAKGKRVVLFLSRIDPKKGIELLLSAFALVRNEIQNLLLVIAGSGDRHYEESLCKTAEQLGISADVIWTGFLSGEEKTAALAVAEIFVLPSYSENFGIAAAEAFAAGKACVLSDQVGLADDARHVNAAIVVPCDANALAEAVKSVLSNIEHERQLGSAALEFAKTRLSMASIGEQLEEEYRAAIAAS